MNPAVDTSAALSLRERKKLAQKEHLCITALRLFQQQGYEQTSVDAVCQEAQVARQTFFNYFPRKDSVLTYFWERKMRALHEALADTGDFPDGLKEQLLWVLQRLVAGNQDQRELLRVVVFEVLRSSSALEDDRAQRQGVGELFGSLCRAAAARGELPHGVDPGVLASLIESVYFWTFWQWVEAPSPFPLWDELVARVEGLWRGVAPAPGKKGKH